MAIISEMPEESSHSDKPSTTSFSASFDPSSPMSLMEKVLDFLGTESNFLGKETAENDIVATVSTVKERMRMAEKERVEKAAAEPMEVEKPLDIVKENKKKEESGRRAPNRGNGLDFENYSWTQTLQEVTVNVPVPSGTKARFVLCEVQKSHLKVGLKGQPPIIGGVLHRPVKPDDSYWNIEEQKVVLVLLTKHDEMEWWKCLVKGEPEIDTQKVETESSKLSDLDPETRQTVEKNDV